MRMVQLVTNLLMLLFMCLFLSCRNDTNNIEFDLVNKYVQNYKLENDINSICLDENNSNIEIFERLKRISKLSDLKKSNTILDSILSEKELAKIKEQLSEENWNAEILLLSKGCDSNSVKKLHLTKPIYVFDEKYALIYSYEIGSKSVIFYPPIEVYFHDETGWKKIYELKENGFKSSF